MEPCCVCLETDITAVIIRPCDHRVCGLCIRRLRSCPMCRGEINSINPIESSSPSSKERQRLLDLAPFHHPFKKLFMVIRRKKALRRNREFNCGMCGGPFHIMDHCMLECCGYNICALCTTSVLEAGDMTCRICFKTIPLFKAEQQLSPQRRVGRWIKEVINVV